MSAKSTSEGKKNSKTTETSSKRELKCRENSAREDDANLQPPKMECVNSSGVNQHILTMSVLCRWTKELTFQMLTEITEDKDIK
jgi:hypothetical protein